MDTIKRIVGEFESRVRAYIKENFDMMDFKQELYNISYPSEVPNTAAVIVLTLTDHGRQVVKIAVNGSFIDIMAKVEMKGEKKLPTTFFTDLTTEIMGAWASFDEPEQLELPLEEPKSFVVVTDPVVDQGAPKFGGWVKASD